MLAIIQARLNSDRFPGKVLADLAGKPVLKHVIDRVRQAEMVSSVVVAMSEDGAETLLGHCEEWGVLGHVFGGTEPDVLGRFASASISTMGKWIVRVCGDNPLIVPGAIDALCKAAKEHPTVDYVGYRDPDGQPTIKRPSGWFAEVVKCSALRRADLIVPEEDRNREHVTSVMYQNPEEYPCIWLELPDWYTDNDLPDVSIDTEEDLERVAEFMASEEMNPEKGWPWK